MWIFFKFLRNFLESIKQYGRMVSYVTVEIVQIYKMNLLPVYTQNTAGLLFLK